MRFCSASTAMHCPACSHNNPPQAKFCLECGAGLPCTRAIWYEQTDDYQNAITWVSMQPEVNVDRIGLWGSSFTGGHVLQVGAYDKRVKAVVSQVPAINGWGRLQRFVTAEQVAGLFGWLAQDRAERMIKSAVNYIPVVAPAGQPSSLPAVEWLKKYLMN